MGSPPVRSGPAAILDTHCLIWLKNQPDKLTAAQTTVLRGIQGRGRCVGISAITLWEIAMLVSKGRVQTAVPLSDLLERIEKDPTLVVLPLSGLVAAASVDLGEAFHGDPADRLITATAKVYGLPLLTADQRIRESGVVTVI